MSDHTDPQLDALLRAGARTELAREVSPVADRLIEGLDTPPRTPMTVRTPLLIAAVLTIIASASVWFSVAPAPPAPVHPGVLAEHKPHGVIDPRVPEVIDNAADGLLNPYRAELEALASISRDSLRNFAGFLPLGG